MSPAFRQEPEASAELEDAALWYESQRPKLGLEFVQAIDHALAQIAEWPESGRRVGGVPTDAGPQGTRETVPLPRRVFAKERDDPNPRVRA